MISNSNCQKFNVFDATFDRNKTKRGTVVKCSGIVSSWYDY
jgi:hypothetical protein